MFSSTCLSPHFKFSLTPPPPRSFSRSSSTPSQAKGNGLRLPPHFNGRNALVLDTSPLPCCLALPPRTSHSLPSHSPSSRLPHPLPIPITSPSPRLLHSLSVSSLHLLHPRPSFHHPHPSPVSLLPLVVSLSPLPFSLSLSLSLLSHLQWSCLVPLTLTLTPRASLAPPQSPSHVTSPLLLFVRGCFFFGPRSLCRPLTSSPLSMPTSMPARLRRQIRYVLQCLIF